MNPTPSDSKALEFDAEFVRRALAASGGVRDAVFQALDRLTKAALTTGVAPSVPAEVGEAVAGWRSEVLELFDEFADESADGVFDDNTKQAALWVIDALQAALKAHGHSQPKAQAGVSEAVSPPPYTPPCDHAWSDQDYGGDSYCRKCGVRSQGSCQ